MTCLLCRYYKPIEPLQHKQDREAGRCQSACGNKWDQTTAINYVRNHGSLDGWCLLHPEPKKKLAGHVCGDISVKEHFFNHHWCVEPFRPSDNLFEWSEKAFGTVLHGVDYGVRGARLDANLEKEEKTELRRQLKRAREISASRLKRLQKIESKPISEPERPAAVPANEEPAYPRLVAAE